MPVARWLAAVLIASAAAAAPVPKELRKPADYYCSAVGTRWEYIREGTNDLDHTREVVTEEVGTDGSRISEEKWVSHVGRYGSEDCVRLDATGLYRIGSNKKNLHFKVPYQLFKVGAKTDEAWDAGVFATAPGGKPAYTGTHGKQERLTLPAGTFDAIPVTIAGTSNPSDVNTFWYAAGVGLVKWKQSDGTTIVLSKFVAGAGAKK